MKRLPDLKMTDAVSAQDILLRVVRNKKKQDTPPSSKSP